MIPLRQALEFERPILELEQRLVELRQIGDASLEPELRRLETRTRLLLHETFSRLTAWQKVQLSRHPLRPYTLDYVGRLVEGFVELHGDRAFADDPAVVGGVGALGGLPVFVIGHQKGRGTKDNLHRNFGMPRPEGYRKARRLMEMAARLHRPIVTLIDTQGAYPGLDAEARGQAEAIAKNLEVMSRLPTPIVSVVIGEGGSGGALAIGVADRILMLEYAIYSVITPEGCAAILWRDQKRVEDSARQLHLTAPDLDELGVIDEIIGEPPGGAHRDHDAAARAVGGALARHLAELIALPPDELLDRRREKFRRIGAYLG